MLLCTEALSLDVTSKINVNIKVFPKNVIYDPSSLFLQDLLCRGLTTLLSLSFSGIITSFQDKSQDGRMMICCDSSCSRPQESSSPSL